MLFLGGKQQNTRPDKSNNFMEDFSLTIAQLYYEK